MRGSICVDTLTGMMRTAPDRVTALQAGVLQRAHQKAATF